MEPNQATQPFELVTLQDHENGFKEVEVSHRFKGTSKVRLIAPPRKRARAMIAAFMEVDDIWPVVRACLPDEWLDAQIKEFGITPQTPVELERARCDMAHKWLNQLTPHSGDKVEAICLILAFGDDWQKKMIPMVDRLTTALAISLPKSN